MRRDPEVYVKGRVKHSDHATLHLNGWHRVYQNTETKAAAMRHVAFPVLSQITSLNEDSHDDRALQAGCVNGAFVAYPLAPDLPV